jgi:hypothetical protein
VSFGSGIAGASSTRNLGRVRAESWHLLRYRRRAGYWLAVSSLDLAFRANGRSSTWRLWFVLCGDHRGMVDRRVCSAGCSRTRGDREFALGSVGISPVLSCHPKRYPGTGLDVDALARVTDPAPNSREEARKLLDEFPWASPNDTELSALKTPSATPS